MKKPSKKSKRARNGLSWFEKGRGVLFTAASRAFLLPLAFIIPRRHDEESTGSSARRTLVSEQFSQ